MGLLVLGACSPVTYSDHRKVAKYEYEGVSYDVYEATLVRQGRASKDVFRLVEEGVDPKNLDSHSLVQFGGTTGIVTECSGASLAQCREIFGAELRKRQEAKDAPERIEDDMGY